MLRSETAASPERRAAALNGLRRYQEAPRRQWEGGGAILARTGRASLRGYGRGNGTPVVFIPSLINPPFVLDLAPGASLLQWLADRGINAMLVDWGTPTPAEAERDITGHVEELLVPLLRTISQPPVLVGYCLGGTMALAAATMLPARGVALLAAPWHFAGFAATARRDVAALWRQARLACEQLGLVPMEVLQTGFWHLDPARTIAKFEALAGACAAELATFVALEDWANGGAPLTLAAGRDLFERFFAADDPGQGAWRVGGRAVDPSALPCPIVDFVSTRDRIVPADTRLRAADTRYVDAGHVGMVVGSRAQSLLWQPLADWLAARIAPT